MNNLHSDQYVDNFMDDFILWKKLTTICEGIVDRKVNITLSTMVENDLNSIVSFNDDEVDIFLNALYCKGEPMVIKAIAHELAHVAMNNSNHSNLWEDMVNALYGKIRDEYEIAKIKLTDKINH